jgi:hypothetical protein
MSQEPNKIIEFGKTIEQIGCAMLVLAIPLLILLAIML